MTNQLTLNTWLLQSERSIHLRCPAGLNVSQDEYLKTLRDTAKELELPLQLETANVYWTDAKLQQKRILAKLTSAERYGLLTGLDYVGRVAFVEQKTYLDPFDPPALEKPNYIAAGAVGVVGIGGAALGGIMFLSLGLLDSLDPDLRSIVGCFGCLGPIVVLAGIGLGGLGILLAIDASKAPKRKFDAAFEKWVNDVVKLARRAEVSNELNRIAQALDEAVKLAVDRLFKQRGAEMEADERKRRTAAEIQDELKRRKAEGFS